MTTDLFRVLCIQVSVLCGPEGLGWQCIFITSEISPCTHHLDSAILGKHRRRGFRLSDTLPSTFSACVRLSWLLQVSDHVAIGQAALCNQYIATNP